MSDESGSQYVVRRLTPVECERLQGFPDGWTDLAGCDAEGVIEKVADVLGYEQGSTDYRNLQRNILSWSASTPDTPRYRAMGNSITTFAIEIIGRRIQAYDELHYDEIGI